jgi:hypothetical protein
MDTEVKKKVKFVKVPIDDLYRLKSYVEELEWMTNDIQATANLCMNLLYSFQLEESK